MYHSIVPPDKTVKEASQVSQADFEASLRHARELGFETITSVQLADFLDRNAKIPPRSLILIIDDRRPGTIRDQFMPILRDYGWTVTSAYITGPDLAMEWAWKEMVDLASTGMVDIQPHGYWHHGDTYITEFTEADVIRQELYGPIQVIQERLGYSPTAFIWPGGNFTPEAVLMAREAGYRLGFTIRARGPLLYNWIPQGEEELSGADPRMLLPRYWSRDTWIAVDQAVQLQTEAQAQAEAGREMEMKWIELYCGG